MQILGAYSGLTSRPFDSANPQLDLRLPDGSRLSAVMDVCARPSISIRRARLSRVHLDDLVRFGSVTPDVAGFLSAAVVARKNIMIAGATNAGKTTLLRALANEIPPAASGSSRSSARSSSGSASSPTCTRTSSRSRSGCPTPRATARSRWPSWCAAACA